MTELNLRARKNALRAITRYENKNGVNLKNWRFWYIEGMGYPYGFEKIVEFIEHLDWRFNCGYKVIEIKDKFDYGRVEICLLCDNKLIATTRK